MRHAYEHKYRQAPLIHVDPPDWVYIVRKLIAFGYPKSQIAEAVGCPRSTVYTILRGAQPEWHVGQALIELYQSRGA